MKRALQICMVVMMMTVIERIWIVARVKTAGYAHRLPLIVGSEGKWVVCVCADNPDIIQNVL